MGKRHVKLSLGTGIFDVGHTHSCQWLTGTDVQQPFGNADMLLGRRVC